MPAGSSQRIAFVSAVVALIAAAAINLLIFWRLARAQHYLEAIYLALLAFLLLGLLGFYAAIALQFVRGQDPTILAERIGQLVSAFFQSSAFYYFSGIGFIATALLLQNAGVYSTFVFMLALLGVAILLYGTGSQAMLSLGQGSQSLDKEKIEILLRGKLNDPAAAAQMSADIAKVAGVPSGQYANFAVAGGAAALTAFFGWGLAKYAPDVRDTFRDHTRFALVLIEPAAGSDLTAYMLSAATQYGHPLYVRPGPNQFYLMLPEPMARPQTVINLSFLRTAPTAQGVGRGKNEAPETILLGEPKHCKKGDRNEAGLQLLHSVGLEVSNVYWACSLVTKLLTGALTVTNVPEDPQVPTDTSKPQTLTIH
jgi:hypothetical protein